MRRLRYRSVRSFVRAVGRVSRDESVSFVAGSVAYHAVVALVPLVAFAFLALALFGTEQFAARVLGLANPIVSPAVGRMLREHIVGGAVAGTTSATLVAAATLLWGSVRLFRGLDAVFAGIYRTPSERSRVEAVVDVSVVLLAVPLALVTVTATTAVLSVIPLDGARLVGPLLLTVGLVVVFVPLYTALPAADVGLREALPGAVVAAVGWTLLQQLFQLYVLAAGASAGSAVGAAILVLTWLYAASVVLLTGGVVNAVYAGVHDDHDAVGGADSVGVAVGTDGGERL